MAFDWLRRKLRTEHAAPVTDRFAELIAAGDAARKRDDRARAIAHYEAAHAALPKHLYPLFWLASLYQDVGDLARARDFAASGLAIDPDQIGLRLRMGSIAHALRDPAAALEQYQHAARLDPEIPGIDALIADQLCYVGRLEDGVAAFDRALAREPDSLQLQQNRLFCLNYSSQLTPAALAEEHRQWGRHHEAATPVLQPAPARGDRTPIRIGYVSPDLRDHAVATFLQPLLAHRDRSRFEITCFDTSVNAEDAVSAHLRSLADHWHRVAELSDDALAALVREKGIDILVDLSGHTRLNRLLAFARRPAPVQVAWLGYLATTGLTRMDYRITDAYMDPEGLTESLYTERLVRLPVQSCFRPSEGTPLVAPSPVAQGAPLTFGSVNQWPKVSGGVKDVWSELLVRNPEARLFLIARGGQNPVMQAAIADEFARRGAKAAQVRVFPFMRTAEFLEFLGQIDVALDPFPYGGGTTTMQCLWMGVPVVTLAGGTALSRNAIAPLTHAGLSELVAETPAGYVEIATKLGRDREQLATIRSTLRARMQRSLLTDGEAFARSFEAACENILANAARLS